MKFIYNSQLLDSLDTCKSYPMIDSQSILHQKYNPIQSPETLTIELGRSTALTLFLKLSENPTGYPGLKAPVPNPPYS
jgi:hypothetical protein